jgi:ABC-type multidrug transport system permease subunit
MSAFEQRMVEKYGLRIAPWKRPVLLVLSSVVLATCIAAAYFQLQYHWTNDGVWLVIVLFGVLGLAGLVAALFLNDAWVALILGGV